jgi:hypothetical protein
MRVSRKSERPPLGEREVIFMGYTKSKTHHRDEISGLHVQDDVQDGTHGIEDLSRRNQSRQDSINAAIKGDWPENMTATNADADHPTYGNAGSRLPRPSDVSSKGTDRYGLSVTPGEQAKKPAPRDNSKASR